MEDAKDKAFLSIRSELVQAQVNLFMNICAHKKNNVADSIISWYLKNGRKYYWRINEMSDWGWLFLELLLRKTQAGTVNQYFPNLIKKYNSPDCLLSVKKPEMESDLYVFGLYNQRIEALRLVAETLKAKHGGKLPSDESALLEFPHVGPYIANAVRCFCFKLPSAIVDMNVARVLTRISNIDTPKTAKIKWIWEYARFMLPSKNWVEYNYGLLDIGALFCRAGGKKCDQCPLNKHCAHYNYGKV